MGSDLTLGILGGGLDLIITLLLLLLFIVFLFFSLKLILLKLVFDGFAYLLGHVEVFLRRLLQLASLVLVLLLLVFLRLVRLLTMLLGHPLSFKLAV